MRKLSQRHRRRTTHPAVFVHFEDACEVAFVPGCPRGAEVAVAEYLAEVVDLGAVGVSRHDQIRNLGEMTWRIAGFGSTADGSADGRQDIGGPRVVEVLFH